MMIKPRFYNAEKSVCCMKQSTWSVRCWQATHLCSFFVASEAFLGFEWFLLHFQLTFSLRCLSYRYQPIDLQRKSKEWFLSDQDLRQERVKGLIIKAIIMFEIIFIVGTHTLPWNYMWSQKTWWHFFEMKKNSGVGLISFLYVILRAIWYHLYHLINVKNTYGWVFVTFLKLYKRY